MFVAKRIQWNGEEVHQPENQRNKDEQEIIINIDEFKNTTVNKELEGAKSWLIPCFRVPNIHFDLSKANSIIII